MSRRSLKQLGSCIIDQHTSMPQQLNIHLHRLIIQKLTSPQHNNERFIKQQLTIYASMVHTHLHEHWWLVEDRNGQVGYAPLAFMMVILDNTVDEVESDATKIGTSEQYRCNQD